MTKAALSQTVTPEKQSAKIGKATIQQSTTLATKNGSISAAFLCHCVGTPARPADITIVFASRGAFKILRRLPGEKSRICARLTPSTRTEINRNFGFAAQAQCR